jgi:hypothetical protein
MSAAALDLERRSPQGRAIRLRFDRRYFHRRAENFQDWKLLSAWRGETLVGIAGAALKAATYEEREVLAAYFFDIRVAREERRARLAKQLIGAFGDYVVGKVDLTYGYTAGDNEAAQKLAERVFGNVVGPAFRCLVYPVSPRVQRPDGFVEADGLVVHARYVAAAGPFGLYCDPTSIFGTDPHVGSWLFSDGTGGAGASAWSNEGIMAEVIDRVPVPLSIVGAALRLPLLRHLQVPTVPRRGEAVRSWYVFDLHAEGVAAARALIAGISAEARARGIDYLYLLHHGDEPWIGAVRADVPRLFSPVVPYHIVGGAGDKTTPVPISRPYIDVRDV